MSVSFAQMQSESAYDALIDGAPIILSVMRQPRTADELVAAGVVDAAQAERQLGRLLRAGLLRQDGGRYLAIADVIEHTRQEGIITSLSHHVLPVVTRIAAGEVTGFVEQLDLELSPEEQAGLRQGRVHPLIAAVDEVSKDAGPGVAPYLMLAVGTSDVPSGSATGDRLIETVRRAARQRSTPAEAPRAVLTEYHGLFSPEGAREAEARVRQAAAALGSRTAAGKRPAYTLALVFCARRQSGNGSEA